jgi:hypothetical protein
LCADRQGTDREVIDILDRFPQPSPDKTAQTTA